MILTVMGACLECSLMLDESCFVCFRLFITTYWIGTVTNYCCSGIILGVMAPSVNEEEIVP